MLYIPGTSASGYPLSVSLGELLYALKHSELLLEGK